MQTTLLGLAIAFIIALVAALIGPYFIDWNQFRPQFEAEASRVIGAPVRVGGQLEARLLPAPSLRLRSVTVGGANDLGKVRADRLDVEFSLSSLMRGEWRATELTINGMSLDLGLDPKGRIDWPVSSATFNLGSLAIDRLNLTGRVALHDAASHGTLELNDIAFSGDVRALAGSVRGDGNFVLSGTRYPFRVSSGDNPDGKGTRLHLGIDRAAPAMTADLDGVLRFEARAPRFEGALALTTPRAAAGSETSPKPDRTPWRISARIKADPAAATLDQIEASYGAEDRALRFVGTGDIRFGASPRLHASLAARQLDADRLFTIDSDRAAEPVGLLPGLRALIAAIPPAPIPAQIALSAEQITLGGRPLQNIVADLRADAQSWSIDRLDFRAPGATQVGLTGTEVQAGPSGLFRGALDVTSSDPDTLASWLQGRSETSLRTQQPLHLRGDLSVTADRVALDAMKAEIDGGAVQGRIAVLKTSSATGSRLDAQIKADRLDLDAATAFVRSLAGPQGEWPEQAQVSLDVDRAISAGHEWPALTAKLSYGEKSITLDQFKVGDAGDVLVEGAGEFDRANATGKLTLNSTASSLGKITNSIASFAPALSSRFDAFGTGDGPAHLKLALDLGKDPGHADRTNARVSLGLDGPQLAGTVTVTAKPASAALRDIDVEKIRHTDFEVESKLSSARPAALLALLGLDHAVAAGAGVMQFEGSITGAWDAPLRLKATLSGPRLDAEAHGTAQPWATNAKADVNLAIRHADLTPLFGLKPADTMMQDISLSSRVSLAGGKWTFDNLDGAVAGSRLRGHVSVTPGSEKTGNDRSVDGEVGLDTLDLSSAFALAVGSAGRDASEPLGSGLLKGWRGRVAFQAVRGTMPGAIELRPASGVVTSDGQSLTLDGFKGAIGGGQASANLDARPTADGIAISARIQLDGVDGSALRYRALAMPEGHTSLQMTLAAQGRSAAALVGGLSGGGTVTLESAGIAGLNPRAFEVAIRAGDAGQATDDTRLRQIVEPALSAGKLSVASAQIPFTIRDGRLRVAATTLDSTDAKAVVSGGYDIPADQADIRATLTSTKTGSGAGRAEIQLFAAGPPDKLDRTVDVSALSSWLAVRAIDRETRRLDSIERGEAPPALPASVPPPAAAPPSSPPSSPAPPAALPDLPVADVPLPGRDPRRVAPKPRVSAPRPLPAYPNPVPPVVSQQAAPLPPPIEVRPAPGPAVRPKPRAPLVLTPQLTNPQAPASQPAR